MTSLHACGTKPGRVDRPTPGASIREVCLLGRRGGVPHWPAGERVEWHGRPYRVEALEPADAGREPWRYVHLKSA